MELKYLIREFRDAIHEMGENSERTDREIEDLRNWIIDNMVDIVGVIQDMINELRNLKGELIETKANKEELEDYED